jgi:arylsulfatase A-like enzyme
MTRALYTAFHVLAAFYCVLCYVPFTYHQVIAGNLLPALNDAARWHAAANAGATALLLILLMRPWRSGGPARWIALAAGATQVAWALMLLYRPLLPELQDDWRSFAAALWSLSGPLLLGAAQVAASNRTIRWGSRMAPASGRHAAAAALSAIFVCLLYAGLTGRPPAGPSLLAHLLVFLALALVLEWIIRLTALLGRSAAWEFWLCQALLACGIALFAARLLCPAIGFSGWQGVLFSACLGVTLALQNAAAGETDTDGIAAALSPLAPSRAPGAITVLVLASAGAAYFTTRVAPIDWNFLVQQLIAAVFWLVAFACFYRISAPNASSSVEAPPRPTRALASLAPGPRPPFQFWIALPLSLVVVWRVWNVAPASAHDPSSRLAQQILEKPAAAGGFFRFLGRNTNIAASVPAAPAPVDLVASLTPSAGPLPDIFIVTIDSLRCDYLSPYNPAVAFTPAIDAFARESTVFRNAFTRYGGTGLSEPAIWSGAMLLHKQYVQPFAPMNSLEKLLLAERYKLFLSRDTILAAILKPETEAVELDPAGSPHRYDLASSLESLERELDRELPSENRRPFFAYTQPQNIHIAVIQREGAQALDGRPYPGFYAPYASRLARVDESFGRFIEFLKARRLYDRSIVILTADHGDSLGEEGRWGHAYTLFPEIVRLPLIVHLPADMQARVSADPEALAFSTDITPSIYYLLGHRPVIRHELYGSPLFTETPAERARDPRASYLLAASYGPVYGILSGGGRRLYVADGVNYRAWSFDLGTPGSAAARSDSAQDELIRRGILAINRFYHFGENGIEP